MDNFVTKEIEDNAFFAINNRRLPKKLEKRTQQHNSNLNKRLELMTANIP